jgi:hypothetical protein
MLGGENAAAQRAAMEAELARDLPCGNKFGSV